MAVRDDDQRTSVVDAEGKLMTALEKEGHPMKSVPLTCLAFLLSLSVSLANIAFAACPGDQITRLLDNGFSKAEILQLCGAGGKPTDAEEVKPDTPPPAERTVKLGQFTIPLGPDEDGSFSVRARGKRVIFSNPDNPDTIGWSLSKTDYPSPRAISVTVTTDVMPVDGNIVGTGIMYAYRGSADGNSTYYVILLTGDGAVTIARRTPEGLKRLAKLSNPDIVPGRPTVLTVTEKENQQGKLLFAVAVNGKSIGSFGGGTVGPGGLVGIAYSGIGNHGFEDLEIGPAEKATPQARHM